MRHLSVLSALAVVVLAGCSDDAGPDAGPSEVVELQWVEAELLSERTVELFYPVDDYKTESCWAPDPQFRYTDDYVEVRLQFKRVREYCTTEGKLGDVASVVVKLPEPIEDRDVIPWVEPRRPDDFPPSTLGKEADPEDCAGATKTSATVDISQVENLQRGDGEFTISLIMTEDLPGSFEDPLSNEIVTARPRFVGVRYTVTNDAATQFQPIQISGHMRLTDGDHWWGEADYTAFHKDVSNAWSVTRGDDQTVTMIGAGSELTTWVVFDIPEDAKPTGLAFALIKDQRCLRLP